MDDPRKQIIIALRGKRYTYKKIGQHLKISKQRVHQIFIDYKSPYTKIKLQSTREKQLKIEGIKLQGRDFVREKIRKRDGYTCQACNKVWKRGKRRFDVHHIDCIKEKSQQYDNYEIEKDNMITLCHKCHLNIKEHRKKIKDSCLKFIHSRSLAKIY